MKNELKPKSDMLSERSFILLALGWIGLAFVTRISIYPFERFSMFSAGASRTFERAFIMNSKGVERFSNSLLSHLVRNKATCKQYVDYCSIYKLGMQNARFSVLNVRSTGGHLDTNRICECAGYE